MAKTRIVETVSGKFVPQVFQRVAPWGGRWEGLYIRENNEIDSYLGVETQLKRCQKESFEEASEVIRLFLEYKENKERLTNG